jgi:integrase
MPTTKYWVDRLHQDYLDRGKKESTWIDEYWKVFKRLPPEAELTPALLHPLVLSSPVNTRSRVRFCMAIGVLAKFAGLDYEPSRYRGTYNSNATKPRTIPEDDILVSWFCRLKNPGWRWFYGMVATYGLRPHEVFRLELEQLRSGSPIIQVGQNTKTGAREVWAYHPEWFEQFDLANPVIPPIALDRENRKLGESAADYFRETARLPFVLYNMRHAWAIRAHRFGLTPTLAAQQMGHSLEVHNEIYQKWISRKIHQDAYTLTLKNPDRPQAPKFPNK